MENTANNLFENDTPQWYIAMGDQWAGPLTASDVYQKVLAQEISWAHYVWKPGQNEWQRICDTKAFQVVVPQVPEKKPVVKKVERTPSAPVSAVAEERIWFLYYNDSQFGPYSQGEIERYLKVGRINGRVHAWRDGMENWERIERIETFKNIAPPSAAPTRAKPPAAPAGKGKPQKSHVALATANLGNLGDNRLALRKPLVAKIMMANVAKAVETASALSVAVCRDISVGGMQVLTDKVPGRVGDRIKLNVSSPAGQINAFVADGVIVRVLEDGRGFSFRFDRLTDDAKKAIESYISANG